MSFIMFVLALLVQHLCPHLCLICLIYLIANHKIHFNNFHLLSIWSYAKKIIMLSSVNIRCSWLPIILRFQGALSLSELRSRLFVNLSLESYSWEEFLLLFSRTVAFLCGWKKDWTVDSAWRQWGWSHIGAFKKLFTNLIFFNFVFSL